MTVFGRLPWPISLWRRHATRHRHRSGPDFPCSFPSWVPITRFICWPVKAAFPASAAIGPSPWQGGCRRAVRWVTIRHVGLRGEGSNPVPLPPPDLPGARVLRALTAAQKPSVCGLFSFRVRLAGSDEGLFFSERAVFLRTSGLRRFSTVLKTL
jgi:hypothetical protein